MGLGKTAMLLALAAHDHAGPTLVVAPTSVVGNWVREAERFTPDLRVAVHHGGTRGDPVAAAAAPTSSSRATGCSAATPASPRCRGTA